MSVNKITSERTQRALLELVAKPGNDVCADCKTRNPRWASYNLGIFICVNCASIHRKMGTHISKVKSLTLDSWTKEQVEVMKEIGNVKSNAIYNPNETRHPPPPNMMESERDSELEKFIRSKYEYKRFIDKSALVASKLGPSRSANSLARPQSTPLSPSSASPTSKVPPPANAASANPLQYRPSTAAIPSAPSTAPQLTQPRSVSQPLTSSQTSSSQKPTTQPTSNSVWADLISLQTSGNSSLPLQYQLSQPPTQPMSISTPTGMSMLSPQGINGNPYVLQHTTGLSISPGQSFSLVQSPTSMTPGMSLSTALGSTNPFPQQQHQQQFMPGSSFQGSSYTGSFSPTSAPNAGFANMIQPSLQQFQPQPQQPQLQQPQFVQQPQFIQQPQFTQQQQPQQPFFPSPSPGIQMAPTGQQFYQPQPQQQLQIPQQPGFMTQSQTPQPFHSTPSPFGQMQSQQQQQQQQQMLGQGHPSGGVNPFTSWVTGTPGGFGGGGGGGYQQAQSQWGGM